MPVLPVWAANNQRRSCPVELPASAELRGGAAHRHPLPEHFGLEVSWGSACCPGVCEIQSLEWWSVRGGRRARARSPGRLLLGNNMMSPGFVPFSWHHSCLSDFQTCCSTCDVHVVELTRMSPGFQIKDGRWHQTHFVFHSLDPSLLPVVDIYNLPGTTPGSHYHLEVGPVCFLWGSQFKSSDHGGMDHHPLGVTLVQAWRSEQSPPIQGKAIQASTRLPPNRSCFSLPNSHWTADTEGGSTGSWGRGDTPKSWREAGEFLH